MNEFESDPHKAFRLLAERGIKFERLEPERGVVLYRINGRDFTPKQIIEPYSKRRPLTR